MNTLLNLYISLHAYVKNDAIQMVFITDRRTPAGKAYKSQEEIKTLLSLDIQKGIPKEE